MPRATPLKQAEKHIKQFFDEVKGGILQDITKTRQMPRRKALLAQLDTFDKVEGRFYHWLTSQVAKDE